MPPHDSTTGAPDQGKAGVPVVDLTALVAGLRAHAAAATATGDYLRSLADTLDGTT